MSDNKTVIINPMSIGQLRALVEEQAGEIAKFNGVFIPQHDYDKMVKELKDQADELSRLRVEDNELDI